MKILEKEPLKKHSYIRIGGEARYFAVPETVEELTEAIEFARNKKLPFYIIGGGSNILFHDEGYQGVIINTSCLQNININGEIITVGAGVSLPELSVLLQKEGLSGMEELCEIPGTIGGAIAGNAGAFGREISELFVEGKILDSKGNLVILGKEELKFSYRNSHLKKFGIIVEAKLKLTLSTPNRVAERMKEFKKLRREHQPVGELSLGSVFRNPPGTSAGFLLDKAGFKGYTIGGAKFSEKHANFIVNFNNAKAEDVKALIKEAKKKVFELFGIDIECEIIILGPKQCFTEEEFYGV